MNIIIKEVTLEDAENMEVKYIASIDTIVLFSNKIVHRDMMASEGMDVVSAGFVDDRGCYGESDSIGVACDESLSDIVIEALSQ